MEIVAILNNVQIRLTLHYHSSEGVCFYVKPVINKMQDVCEEINNKNL